MPEQNEGSIPLPPSISLRQLQLEQVEWRQHNFPNSLPVEPLLGIGEETGELMHAHLKGMQGIRLTPEQVHAKKKDALADILIYCADYATREGIDLEAALAETWAEVRQRDWQKNKLDADKQVKKGVFKDNSRVADLVCPFCSGIIPSQQVYGIYEQPGVPFHLNCATAIVKSGPIFNKPPAGISRSILCTCNVLEPQVCPIHGDKAH